MAIQNGKTDSSPIVPEILEYNINHKSAGTKIMYVWIPSHVGIQGNEVADQLATDRRAASTGDVLRNPLTQEEICKLMKDQSKTNNLVSLKSRSNNMAVQARSSTGLQPWLNHLPRAMFTACIRLRSGHNKLNRFMSKMDPDTDQNCPNGCQEREDARHVLLECSTYSEERKTMEATCRSLNTPFDLPSILGLNSTTSRRSQLKISKRLAQCLITTKLIKRV